MTGSQINAEKISNEDTEAGKIFKNITSIQDNQSENETRNVYNLEKNSSQATSDSSTLKQTNLTENIAAVGTNLELNSTGIDPPWKIGEANGDDSLDEAKLSKLKQGMLDFSNGESNGNEISHNAVGKNMPSNNMNDNNDFNSKYTLKENPKSSNNMDDNNNFNSKDRSTFKENHKHKTLENTSEESYFEDAILDNVLNGISPDIIMDKLETLKKEHNSEEAEDLEEFMVWTSVVDSVNKWKKKRKGKRVKRDEEVVCYQELGCFRDVGFFDYLDTLPESPDEVKTRFILHTPDSRESGEIIDYKNASSLYYSRFMNLASIKVIIHGFGGGGTNKWVIDMKNALLKSVSIPYLIFLQN